MPIRRLIVSMRNLQNRLFAEWLAEKLQANWQLRILRKSARQAETAYAGEVARNREDVGEIHLHRVVGFFAGFERGRRRGGRDDGIHLLEGFQKILPDQRANFLRAQIKR